VEDLSRDTSRTASVKRVGGSDFQIATTGKSWGYNGTQ
jgi:hypothetical protein